MAPRKVIGAVKFNEKDYQSTLDRVICFARDFNAAEAELSGGFKSAPMAVWDIARAHNIPQMVTASADGPAPLAGVLEAMEAIGTQTGDLGFCLALVAHAFGCAFPIHLATTAELRVGPLAALHTGVSIGAGAMTEECSGSDAFAMQTTATLNGDCYLLNGEKRFITNGEIADTFLVYAKTSPGCLPFCISAFLVDRKTPGLSIRSEPEKIGTRTASWVRMSLNECSVPLSSRVGSEGVGGSLFMETMRWERMALAAAQIGAMQASLDRCVAFAKSRHRFGAPLAALSTISHQIADMRVRLEAARSLLGNVADTVGKGASLQDDHVAIVKLAVSTASFENGCAEARLHGAIGVTELSGATNLLCDSMALQNAAGTLDIQRELVARGLGLTT